MTNEIPIKDAIDLLESAKKHSKENLMFCFNERGQRILDMAIKALQAVEEADEELAEASVYDSHTIKAQQILRGVGR